MSKITQIRRRFQRENPQEQKGQSLVIIALALVGLLAFVGIAIDVGFIFARGSQLQAAIDSAALAGVVELAGGNTPGNRAGAITKSGQFLNANGMPISVTQSLNIPDYSNVEITPLGVTEYSITATWPVETYFLNVIGFRDRISLTRSATAAIFSLADIYASYRIEDGVLGTSNQSVFGPKICTSFGDPFSPWNSRYTPGDYQYQYRIMIPPDYPHDIVRVELFDPDSINQAANTQAMFYSQAALNTGEVSGTPSGSCPDNRKNACLIRTGEAATNGDPVGGLDHRQINPFWFMRVDENRGAGSGDGNGTCGEPGSYTARYNTETLYQLYYWRENADGTLARVDLSSYVGQVGDGVRDNGNHNTDMQWVSPGAAQQSYDYESFFPGSTVDVEPGSATSFEIDLSREVPNMVTDARSGVRYIYMDVTTISGASENGFEIWAGPPNYVDSVPGDVNARNIYVLNNPGSHSSQGVTVFAMGNLPMNSNASYRTEIPFIYLGPEFAGQNIFVSLFDPDAGMQEPITFYFDTIAREDFELDFGLDGIDPDGIPSSSRCSLNPPGCGDTWITPPYSIPIPGDSEICDPSDPDDINCIPFYGGRLMVEYQAGAGDTYVWQITITGLPYLVR